MCGCCPTLKTPARDQCRSLKKLVGSIEMRRRASQRVPGAILESRAPSCSIETTCSARTHGSSSDDGELLYPLIPPRVGTIFGLGA